MFKGETVTVLRPVVAYDEHMDEVVMWEEEAVENVLVAPSATSDLNQQERPHGTRASVSLHFPKGFSESLRGCRVKVWGREYGIVGDPQPYRSNCPTDWWYPAEAEAVDG